MKLSDKCVELYRDQYPEDSCGFLVPGCCFKIENEDTMYIQLENETDELFKDRLERSKMAGRNLFYEEWETFEYDDDCVY